MATRLENLRRRLEEYYTAESAITGGAQSYRAGGRQLTRGDLPEIAAMIKYLEQQTAAEEAAASGRGRNKVTGIIPRDF